MSQLWISLATAFFIIGVTCAVKNTLLLASPSPGYIVSQGWPMNYPHNHKQIWTLTSFDPNYVVIAQAVATHIEQDSKCRWDYVQVYDGTITSSQSLGRFCGFARPLLSSTNESLTIIFNTDNTRSYAGFKIKYWCNLKPGVKVKSIYSDRDNIIAVALASVMFVTVSYICIIACRGSHGRTWLPSNFRTIPDKYPVIKMAEDHVLIDLDKHQNQQFQLDGTGQNFKSG